MDDLGRVARVLVRVVPPHAVAHELRVALVDSNDDRVVTGLERGVNVARDDVQLALGAHDVHAERREQLRERRDLCGEDRRRELRLRLDDRDRARGA
jgi:hypothetical protein